MSASDTIHDNDLIFQIRRGDRAAFDTLYLATFSEVWRHAYHLVGTKDLADDIVQDVYISFWLNRATLLIRTTVRAYLYGAVRNTVKSYFRARYRYEGAMGRVALANPHGPLPVSGSMAPLPSDEAIQNDTVSLLQRAIRKLPERQRLAMSLWVDDFTPDEIAEILGVTTVAVRKLLAKASATISERLNAIL